MAYKAKSTKRRYEESLKAPLLFCYYEQKSGFDDYGMRYSYGGWFSCDSTINLYISESELEKDDSERKLFIIGKQILENGEVDLKKVFYLFNTQLGLLHIEQLFVVLRLNKITHDK